MTLPSGATASSEPFFFIIKYTMCFQLNIYLFPACRIFGILNSYSFQILSLSLSLSAHVTFSRTLWVSSVYHMYYIKWSRWCFTDFSLDNPLFIFDFCWDYSDDVLNLPRYPVIWLKRSMNHALNLVKNLLCYWILWASNLYGAPAQDYIAILSIISLRHTFWKSNLLNWIFFVPDRKFPKSLSHLYISWIKQS